MSRHENEVWNEVQEEMSRERFDRAIDGIIESDIKIKEIDAKIAEKKRLLRETNSINLGDLGLLPLIW